MKRINSFGIICFKKTRQVSSIFHTIYAWSQRNQVPVFFHPDLATYLTVPIRTVRTQKELMKKSDALISIGGDGTFLSVARMVQFTEKPVIGINLGGLGFLADIDPENIEESLQKIHQGDYLVINRMVIQAQLRRNNKTVHTLHALNDFYINRLSMPKLTSISAWHGECFISDFQADGIIVSTPSGSTAYSLSAGGPIVEPSVRAFILTPICPHSLTERSVILPADQNIRLMINNKNPRLLFSADGIVNVTIRYKDEIIISNHGDRTNLIQLAEHDYFTSLRTKLNWGQDHGNRRKPNP